MPLEEWFDAYQYEVDHDIGESGVKFRDLASLGVDLSRVELRYGHHRGSPELRRVLSEQYEDFSPDQICVTTGSSEANFSIIASLVGDSDHMIVEHPNYPSLYEVPRSLGLQNDALQLSFDDQFKPDLEELELLMKPTTKLVTLTHPNNPTGSVISEKTLREVIELVESHNCHLLHDETYRELSFEKPPPPAAVLSDRAISITTTSKTYGLPGIRIGWIAGPRSVIDSVRAIREQITICNNSLGETIARSIIERRDELLKEIREGIKTNFSILKDWMNRQNALEWVEPRGGVVAFPRLKDHTSTEQLCRLLVSKYRTFTIPGYCFDMPEHLRIGFGGFTEEIRSGLGKLELALNEYALTPQTAKG